MKVIVYIFAVIGFVFVLIWSGTFLLSYFFNKEMGVDYSDKNSIAFDILHRAKLDTSQTFSVVYGKPELTGEEPGNDHFNDYYCIQLEQFKPDNEKQWLDSLENLNILKKVKKMALDSVDIKPCFNSQAGTHQYFFESIHLSGREKILDTSLMVYSPETKRLFYIYTNFYTGTNQGKGEHHGIMGQNFR